MPAHKSAAHVGKLRLSNGELLSKRDVDANDMTGGFAKKAVEEHRVPPTRLRSGKGTRRRRGALRSGPGGQ